MGTCLLASVECPIHENYKQAILKAKDSDTTVTGRSTGAPVRVLKNKMAREYLRMEKKDVPLEEMEQLTLGSLRKPCSTATWTAAASWPARWPVWCTSSVPAADL